MDTSVALVRLRATMFVSRHASSAEGARSESVGSGRLPGVSSTNRAGGAAGGPRSTSRGPVALRGRGYGAHRTRSKLPQNRALSAALCFATIAA